MSAGGHQAPGLHWLIGRSDGIHFADSAMKVFVINVTQHDDTKHRKATRKGAYRLQDSSLARAPPTPPTEAQRFSVKLELEIDSSELSA